MKPLQILYEDPSLVVAVKPAGVLSQGNEKGQESVLELLSRQLHGEIFPVHRLDRETGGVMVFARGASAAAKLSLAIQEKEFQKEYFAVLTAPPAEEAGEMEDLLFFDRKKGKVFPVKRRRKGVKFARLRYEVKETREDLTLVRVFPETGRTHQIRVQFASRKTPLYGDRKYGGHGEAFGLFCHKLSFPHPETGEILTLSAWPTEGKPWDLFFQL